LHLDSFKKSGEAADSFLTRTPEADIAKIKTKKPPTRCESDWRLLFEAVFSSVIGLA
jgi:hypothetical protein